MVQADISTAAAPARVCTVVLNWNRSAQTERCVASLLRLGYANHRIVLCDNQSDSDDLARTRHWGARLPGGLHEFGSAAAPPAGYQTVLVRTGGNLGFAGGVNAGIRWALAHDDPAFVWILNNDTEVEPGALDALLRRMQADPRIGLCGSTLLDLARPDRVQAWGGATYEPWRARSRAMGASTMLHELPEKPAAVERAMAYVEGASMLASRRFIDVVGPMDERYFLYSEEHDWAHRGRAAGFRLAWAPDSRVRHEHGGTIGSSPQGGSPLSLFYLYRSKALFAWRHHRTLLPFALASLCFEAFKLLVKGHPGKCWAAMRGLAAFPALGHYGKRRLFR